MKSCAAALCVLVVTLSAESIHSIAQAQLQASELQWEAHFGTLREGRPELHCLLSTNAFRAHTSAEFEDLITLWLDTHPDAAVVPGALVGRWQEDDPESRWYYSWVIDGDASLNLHLVRAGGCKAATMLATSTDNLLVPDQAYAKFAEAVTRAESYARENALGVWEGD